ncbi:hypothetical protein VFC49_09245 [Thermococcus sp. SY098]|uniref:hypothetical protein n=1 Tax=Thermococcus sp. SY098 TaxID=3111325 RepID=UPI002D79D9AF|nr:hypothetical protein [Thermococcus sp. SY098]WRS52231.1 hypothetical protein VFC49_09245 [Thermococcus sp. SY098]
MLLEFAVIGVYLFTLIFVSALSYAIGYQRGTNEAYLQGFTVGMRYGSALTEGKYVLEKWRRKQEDEKEIV